MYELCRHGDGDLLIKILENPSYPGWGYMLANDATTVWERWEKENQAMMNSFDHPMFASYDAALFRFFGGITLEKGATKILIAPIVPDALSFVESSLQSPQGKIVSSWRKEKGKITYDIVVPPNSRAHLRLERKASLLDGKPTRKAVFLLKAGSHRVVADL